MERESLMPYSTENESPPPFLLLHSVVCRDRICLSGFAGTWRIVLASLLAFAVSETIDNSLGTWLRDRVHDAAEMASDLRDAARERAEPLRRAFTRG